MQCTKCNDKFTLKSSTECTYEPKAAADVEDISNLSAASSVQMKMDTLENQLAVTFDKTTQSRAITAIIVHDKITSTDYTCQQLSCSYYFNDQDKLVLKFNPDSPVTQARVTIQRAAASGSRMLLFAPAIS